MTQDEYNNLLDNISNINRKITDIEDTVSALDSKYQTYKNLSQLEDVLIQYPAENDVLVYDKTGKWKTAQYDEIGLDPGEGGESDFYIIGIGDPTPPTNENVYAAARTKEDFLSSKEEDQADGTITFNKGIITDSIYSRQWQEGPLGYGLVYHLKDSDDQTYTISYMELDELYVRRKATFDTLEIKKLTSVGGRIIVTPASNEIIRVEIVTEYYNGSYVDVYRCFFRSDDGENAVKTDFVAGDMAQCRQFNISSTGTHENASNRYYWRLVMGVGADYVDLSMTDMDTATTSDAPAAGDTIVQLGNKNNLSRQNAIVLSAYDDNAPSISMYQGINNYTTEGHDVMQIAYDTTQDAEQMYFNLYGRMYVGAKDQHTYMKYDPLTETVTIRGKLLVESGQSVEDVIDDIVEQANTELNQKIDNAVKDLLAEINDVEGELTDDIANLDSTLKSDMAGNLGYGSWNDFVAAATENKTIIAGGYLNTTLIQAGAIKASMISFDVAWGGALQIGPYNCDPNGQNCSYHFNVDTSGNLVTTGDVTCNKGTFNNVVITGSSSNLTVTGGKIGGWWINGQYLANSSGNEYSYAYLYLAYDGGTLAYIGRRNSDDDSLVDLRCDSGTALSIENYSGGKAIELLSNGSGRALSVNGTCTFGAERSNPSDDRIKFRTPIIYKDIYTVEELTVSGFPGYKQYHGISFGEDYDLDGVRLRVRNGLIVGLYNDDKGVILEESVSTQGSWYA